MVGYAQIDAMLQKRRYFHANSFRVDFYKRIFSRSIECLFFGGKDREKFMDELVYDE